MVAHYLQTILRILYRDKVYALINITGLALAITCCLVLLLYVHNELAYDKHHVNHDRIYRIVNKITTSGSTNNIALTSQALGPLLISDYPDIGSFVRVRNMAIPRNVFRHGDTEYTWDDIRFADQAIFTIFTHKVIYGDLEGALVDPSSIAISETFSRAYFGDRNPVGETVSTDTFTYKVTAVFEDLPVNTHLKYSALLSMNRLGVFGINDNNISPQQLFSVVGYTYIMAPRDLGLVSIQQLVTEFGRRRTEDIGRRLNSTLEFYAQPFDSIHFESGLAYDQPTANLFFVYAFIAVAIFMILVACINYTNLATARATRRSKEIGIRRIVGASQRQLAVQFLGESVAYVLVATVIAIFVLRMIELTSLPNLLGKEFLVNCADDIKKFVWVVCGAVAVGLVAGAYPSFYLSSITPIDALTTNRKLKSSGLGLRNILIFFQLFVSIGVISCTLVMTSQMRYVADKPLGFDRKNKLVILLRGVELLNSFALIKGELLNRSGIVGVTRTSFLPGDEVTVNLVNVENNEGQMEPVTISQILVGEEFVRVMGIEIETGRDFSKRLLTDVGTSVVVNESLVRQMGWESPIGKRIDDGSARVIGVVRDFHFDSLHEHVGPIILRPFPVDAFDNVSDLVRNLVSLQLIVSISDGNVFQTINAVESVMSQFDSKHPFEFQFLDDLLYQIYSEQVNLIKLTGVFAAICILISCLGLFGLAAFTTSQRTKEIGIRKVLGASAPQIVLMLSKTLMLLVVIAGVFSSFASFLILKRWLAGFAYGVSIHPSAFLISIALVALLGFMTIVIQSTKTVSSNPVKALRHD